MAKGCFGSHIYIAFVIINIKNGLSGIIHAPHNNLGNFNGIAHAVINFKDFSVQRTRTRRDYRGAVSSGSNKASGKIPYATGIAKRLCIKRIGPPKTLVTNGSHILTKKHAHASLTGLKREESAHAENPHHKTNGKHNGKHAQANGNDSQQVHRCS